LLVSMVTVVSYVIMLSASFVAPVEVGDVAYYSRWLFYGLSCSLLLYEIGRILGKKKDEIAMMIYLIVIVMLTGAFASAFDGGYMITMFVISTVAYLLLIQKIFSTDSSNSSFVFRYIMFGWTVFPIVFLLAPDGFGVIANATAAIAYLALDLFTKIVFYIDGRRLKLGKNV
ncbi:MAG: bacteriorhodopsin, partial [Actinobacteria bacterium]|nr:bacteriorhodopsin [Actinomycetota bacterium]